ncbi:MAG: M48 family metallopeptidase [Deltaproteobacteria bacterium]|nr:M48 family metallopeptidase [Deltaproteobacteria bacterium]
MTSRTMDFFEHQDNARRKTAILTLYFILAVLFLIFGVYAALVIAGMNFSSAGTGFWNPGLFIWVAVSVIIIIFLGNAFKIAALSKGGRAVAEMLGGIPVDPNTTDPDQRRLLNVVEEISIASGVPVPSVYILENEAGINAFAAGHTPGNAVVAVTHGCIKELSRDELQGVIAHEFSHILNGDMRLNIRLMGIIAGILVIAVIGRIIVRGSSSGVPRSRGKKGGGGAIILAGLIIMAVGYIGVFFGKLIKSAVSRQREFLADASAVQFTRNPSGIAGALKKIGSYHAGSKIRNLHAEEASHLFFGNGLAKPFMNLLATHPPIKERIRRIDPSFLADVQERTEEQVVHQDSQTGISSLASQAACPASGAEEKINFSPEILTSVAGNPGAEHLVFAGQILSCIPTAAAEAVREPFGARAVIYCLLLNREEDIRRLQMEGLQEESDPPVMKETISLAPVIDTVGREYRLPLADLAIPALRLLSPGQYEMFRKNVKRLIEADKKISLFEYVMQRVLLRHLDPTFKKMPAPAVRYNVIDQVQVECLIILSVLAWQGNDVTSTAQESFIRGIGELDMGGRPSILAREKCGLNALDSSLERLEMASPQVKKKALKACIACISADSFITVEEAELLRLIADSLDCPMPPFITSGTGRA